MSRLEDLMQILFLGCSEWIEMETEREAENLVYSPSPLCMPHRQNRPTITLSGSSSETEEDVRDALKAGARVFHLPKELDGIRLYTETDSHYSGSDSLSIASEGSKAHRLPSAILKRPRLLAFNSRNWWKRVIRLA